MSGLDSVQLEAFMEQFALLEQKIAGVTARSSQSEVLLGEASRLMAFYQTKERSLLQERDSLLVTVNRLQQTLQEHCNLREIQKQEKTDKSRLYNAAIKGCSLSQYVKTVHALGENEKLKTNVEELKQQKERAAEEGAAEIQRLLTELKAEEERHKRELETIRQQCRRQLEAAHEERLAQLEAKNAEVRKLLEQKELDVEEMKKQLKHQERARQSELLKLQMEFGAKLARIQNRAEESQKQQKQKQSNPNVVAQSFFKRKLQVFQEEKNKEIVALRQRIKELEGDQRAGSLDASRLKKRRI